MSPLDPGEFQAHLTEHFRDVDPLIQVVLTAHLFLEERLNNIIRSVLLNPGVFDKMNLTFHLKMLLARAFAVSQRGSGVWDVLAAMNGLRNNVAHTLDPSGRERKFQTLREIYLREVEDPKLKEEDAQEPPHLLVMKAYAFCTGYIARVEQDAKMFGTFSRRMIDVMRKEYYPLKDEVPEEE